MAKLKFIFFFLGVISVLGCRSDRPDGVLLQIGNYKLTIAEYELVRKSDRNKSLTNEQLEDKLINEGRILAFALAHKYDTIAMLNKHLAYAMRFNAAKVEGYVWNVKVKPKLKAKGASDTYRLTQKFIAESRERILHRADPEWYETGIKEMISKYDLNLKKWTGVNPDLILMKYSFRGKRCAFTAANFIEFVHYQVVFFGSLTEPEDIKEMLKSFLIDEYLFAEAQQMNMESDQEYLQFKKNYQQMLFLEYYKRKYVYPGITIQENEAVNHYHTYRDNFKCFESAAVSIYKFDQMPEALAGRVLLSDQLRRPMALTGALPPIKTEKLPPASAMEIKIADYENDPGILSAMLKLKVGQVSLPIAVKNEYWILYLSSTKGVSILPYSYAQGEIKRILYTEKEKKICALIGKELETKYPIRENRIKEYLGHKTGIIEIAKKIQSVNAQVNPIIHLKN